MNTINFKGIGIKPLSTETSDGITRKTYPGGIIIEKYPSKRCSSQFCKEVYLSEPLTTTFKNGDKDKVFLQKVELGAVKLKYSPVDTLSGPPAVSYRHYIPIRIGDFKREKGFKQFAIKFFEEAKKIEGLTYEGVQTLAKNLLR